MRLFCTKILLTFSSFLKFAALMVADKGKPILIVDALSMPGCFIINGELFILFDLHYLWPQFNNGTFWKSEDMPKIWTQRLAILVRQQESKK